MTPFRFYRQFKTPANYINIYNYLKGQSMAPEVLHDYSAAGLRIMGSYVLQETRKVNDLHFGLTVKLLLALASTAILGFRSRRVL
jgi:hypothetical protein